MKAHIITAPLMLALGVAIGWVARGTNSDKPLAATTAPTHAPADTRAGETTMAAADESSNKPRSKSAIREPKDTSAQGKAEQQIPEEMNSQVRKMMESMASRQRTRLDQHVDRLNASLSLTPDQKAKLTAWLDENTKNAGQFDALAASGDPEKAYQAQTSFSPEGLEDYLAGMLLPDQKEALEDFQQRDKQGKVDALALKNLSQIQKVVEFSDGQRDQVYQILSEAAERKLSEAPKTEQMMSFMHESMGIETDPYDLGVNTLMQDMMGAPENMDMDFLKDNKGMAQKLRDELARRIDEKASLLQPVLNEKQLEQYRTELRTRGGGFVEQMIMGLEMVSDSDTIVIPGDEE
jgi:hypothetical protein